VCVPGILCKTASLPLDRLHCVDASEAERASQQSRRDCPHHASLYPCKTYPHKLILVQEKEKYSECVSSSVTIFLHAFNIL
jgi:hypothetical protein